VASTEGGREIRQHGRTLVPFFFLWRVRKKRQVEVDLEKIKEYTAREREREKTT